MHVVLSREHPFGSENPIPSSTFVAADDARRESSRSTEMSFMNAEDDSSKVP